jgi:hypothetical protein
VLLRAANAVGSDIDFNLPIATRVDDTRIYVRLAEIPKCTSQLSDLSKYIRIGHQDGETLWVFQCNVCTTTQALD